MSTKGKKRGRRWIWNLLKKYSEHSMPRYQINLWKSSQNTEWSSTSEERYIEQQERDKRKVRESTDKATGVNGKIDCIENDLKKFSKDVKNTYERLVPFYSVPESAGEYCILKLSDIISSDLNFQPTQRC